MGALLRNGYDSTTSITSIWDVGWFKINRPQITMVRTRARDTGTNTAWASRRWQGHLCGFSLTLLLIYLTFDLLGLINTFHLLLILSLTYLTKFSNSSCIFNSRIWTIISHSFFILFTKLYTFEKLVGTVLNVMLISYNFKHDKSI